MSCHAAHLAVARSRYLASDGSYRTVGFRCSVVQWYGLPGIPHVGAQERCAAGYRTFQYQWGP
jgi:hypothetical protein